MTDTAIATRAAALDLVSAVLDGGRPLDDALASLGGRLASRDRAFAHAIAATTLRHLGRIDGVLKGFLDRPLPRKAAAARHLLRLGTAQLLFLGTAPHAAVATCVGVARARRPLGPYAGLLNAVLRRVAREGQARLDSLPPTVTDLPRWLIDSWSQAYGAGTAAAIAAACAREAPLDLTPRDGDTAALATRVNGIALPTGSVRLPAGTAVPTLPGFEEGAFWVQDAAAALPVRLMGALTGKRVADLCAAPGGKTLQLAAAGATVTALDRAEARLALVAANLKRCGFASDGGPVTLVPADATEWAGKDGTSDGSFDAVLVDAPCTATGTLRRHPDAPWLKRPGDATTLATSQDALLDAAHRLLAPGGTLLYCVCSLQTEEGLPRVTAALDRHGDLHRRPITAGESGIAADWLTADGDLRLLPTGLDAEGGMDGFFIARLEKKETAPS